MVTRTHTANVESRAVVFGGGGPYTYSGGRGYLLLDWSLEMGCSHLTERFPWRGYYDSRVDGSSLCSRDEDIGEENPHQSSEEWASTDRLIYYAEASREHMLYAIEAMAPTIFNWEEAMIPIFKDQLTKCRRGEIK